MFSPLFVQLAHATMAMRVAIRLAARLYGRGDRRLLGTASSSKRRAAGPGKRKTRAFAIGSRHLIT